MVDVKLQELRCETVHKVTGRRAVCTDPLDMTHLVEALLIRCDRERVCGRWCIL